MDQVMAMFIAQGIKSVRMDDIARQLSISKRTLYEMFGDKEELLYQCIVRHAKSTEQERAKRFKQADNYLEVMLICLREMADKATVANRIRENLRKFYPKVAEKLSNEFESRSIEQLRQWIELCIDQGLFMPKTDIDISLAIQYRQRRIFEPQRMAARGCRTDAGAHKCDDNLHPRHVYGKGRRDNQRFLQPSLRQ